MNVASNEIEKDGWRPIAAKPPQVPSPVQRLEAGRRRESFSAESATTWMKVWPKNTPDPLSVFPVCAFLLALLSVYGGVLNADEVVVSGPAGKGQSRRTGEIVDYTGRGLVLRNAGGAETAIPAERVLEVHTEWNAAHRRGDELFAEAKFTEALEQYRQAVDQEQRPWVRRRLAAQAVWCYRNLGQHEYAAAAFLSLASQDSATPHFHAIPLSWTTIQPGPAFEGRLRNWINNGDSIVSLVAASWLLATGDRSPATEKLRTLSADADPRVAQLAQAQFWRTQQATATADEVARWRKLIAGMPEPLRAGPYYVAGQALARLGAGEDAVLVLMRAPVLYPEHRELAAESLLAAGRELEKLNRIDEASSVYRELAADYSESPLAEVARQRLAVDLEE